MAKEESKVAEELRKWLRGAERVILVGVGNPIRTDDFVGVKIARSLKSRLASGKVKIIEAEAMPEDHLQEIIDYKPTHVLIIDAAILGITPGKAKFAEPEQLTDFKAVSTHSLPLRIFCEHVRKVNAKVGLLLIEPEKTEFGEKMTPTLAKASRKISRMLLDLLA